MGANGLGGRGEAFADGQHVERLAPWEEAHTALDGRGDPVALGPIGKTHHTRSAHHGMPVKSHLLALIIKYRGDKSMEETCESGCPVDRAYPIRSGYEY